MFIFAIFLIPSIIIIIEDQITPKNIVLFVWGIIISSIFSILFYSIGTFYSSYSSTFISKIITSLFNQIIPLIILFGYKYYNNNFMEKIKELSIEFIFGFIYWNLLFTLIIESRVESNFNIILYPVSYSLIILTYKYVIDNTFITYNRFFKSNHVIFYPLFIISVVVFSTLSNILLFIILVLIIVGMMMISLNISGLNNKIFKNE